MALVLRRRSGSNAIGAASIAKSATGFRSDVVYGSVGSMALMGLWPW